MTKKSLKSWYDSDDITYSQREVIKKFGVGDYYPERELKDFKKLWYWDDILKRKKSYLGFADNTVKKMVFFSTWWNNNLIIIINGDSNFTVTVLFYEMPWKNMSEVIWKARWTNYSSNYSSVEKKATELEDKLKGDYPIFYNGYSITLKYDDDYRFEDVQTTTLSLPSSNVENYPDEYLKPLDIVKVYAGKWLHSAVYLGKGKVCHARPDQNDTSSGYGYYGGYSGYSYAGNRYSYSNYSTRSGDSWGWVEITDWSNFLKFLDSPKAKAYKVVRLHPIIPYKHKDKVIRHLAEALEGGVKYFEKRGKFKVESNNCEHFVNLITHGIDISGFLEKKKVEKGHHSAERIKDYSLEGSEGPKGDSESFLNGLTSSWQSSRISQIQNYTEVGGNGTAMREGIKMDARIEVTPKYGYRIGN